MTFHVHLVRHAAHGLLGRVLAGRMAGVHLSEEGAAQAEALATGLAARLPQGSVRLVQASPRERAVETAAPIARAFGLPLEIDPALDEIDFGAWTGHPFDALAADPAWDRWNGNRALARPPAGDTPGEGMAEAGARLLAHLERLRGALGQGRVLLVSHCDVIRAALLGVLGLGVGAWDRLDVDPASVSSLALGDWGARVTGVNENFAGASP